MVAFDVDAVVRDLGAWLHLELRSSLEAILTCASARSGSPATRDRGYLPSNNNGKCPDDSPTGPVGIWGVHGIEGMLFRVC